MGACWRLLLSDERRRVERRRARRDWDGRRRGERGRVALRHVRRGAIAWGCPRGWRETRGKEGREQGDALAQTGAFREGTSGFAPSLSSLRSPRVSICQASRESGLSYYHRTKSIQQPPVIQPVAPYRANHTHPPSSLPLVHLAGSRAHHTPKSPSLSSSSDCRFLRSLMASNSRWSNLSFGDTGSGFGQRDIAENTNVKSISSRKGRTWEEMTMRVLLGDRARQGQPEIGERTEAPLHQTAVCIAKSGRTLSLLRGHTP
jgi:hypothetical protein